MRKAILSPWEVVIALLLAVLVGTMALVVIGCSSWQKTTRRVATTASETATAAGRIGQPALDAWCRKHTEVCEARCRADPKGSLRECCPELSDCAKRHKALWGAIAGVHVAVYNALQAADAGEEGEARAWVMKLGEALTDMTRLASAFGIGPWGKR